MKIFFLDQSGSLGGAELCLLDILSSLPTACLVGLFKDGAFRQRLEADGIPVHILSQKEIKTRKSSTLLQGLAGFVQIIPLVQRAAQLSKDCDLIYANTPKALLVGALISVLNHRPLVYHLHDIISPDHFSSTNRKLLITLANRFASLVIANSEASKAAFITAGGQSQNVSVVYNGFRPKNYQIDPSTRMAIRHEFNLQNKFVVGHFSRLAPWKGQHILIEALTHCPEDVVAMLVGDALFGESEYVQELHRQVKQLGLHHRVKFLGFRSDVPSVMAACDLIAHTSTAPEPFGRVIVEAMLCNRPVVAAAAGGATELISHKQTGWLSPPGDALELANIIRSCRNEPEKAAVIAQKGQQQACSQFNLAATNHQIYSLLQLQNATQ